MKLILRTAALATLAFAGLLAGCNRDAGSGAPGATPAPVTPPPATTVPDTSVPPASAASR